MITQGTDSLQIVLDIVDPHNPVFLVYDSNGHLLGGVQDCTVYLSQTGTLSARATIAIDAVHAEGSTYLDEIRQSPGTDVEIDAHHGVIISQHAAHQSLYQLAVSHPNEQVVDLGGLPDNARYVQFVNLTDGTTRIERVE